jgi:hypothetical protein
MSNLQAVPNDRRCNAKTRAGTPCKNWGIHPSGRCRMHGGKSHGGHASPRLVHGWYSTYFPYTFMRAKVLYQERLRRSVNKRLREMGLDERLADEVM